MLFNSEQKPGSEVQNPHAQEIIEQLQQRAAESGAVKEAPVVPPQEDQKIQLAPDLSAAQTSPIEVPAIVEESHPEVSNEEKKEVVNNLLEHADTEVMTDAAADQEEIFNYNQSE